LEDLPHDRRRLWIRTFRELDPDRVIIEVGDSGKGVSAELQDRLFEPRVTDKPGGLGIGLSIVRTLAENHGGRVWMKPAVPSGAVFSVELPVGEETP
jgi:two-component system sensor kinase FixL